MYVRDDAMRGKVKLVDARMDAARDAFFVRAVAWSGALLQRKPSRAAQTMGCQPPGGSWGPIGAG